MRGPPTSPARSPGFVWGGSDLMRLVCGLSTLRLFKASLKISGCRYYMSEEEEMLAWRSQPGELFCNCSWGLMGVRKASERRGAQGRLRSPAIMWGLGWTGGRKRDPGAGSDGMSFGTGAVEATC